MRKDFVNEVAQVQRFKRTDLIEKDLILHQVLFDLSKDQFFHENSARATQVNDYVQPDARSRGSLREEKTRPFVRVIHMDS